MKKLLLICTVSALLLSGSSCHKNKVFERNYFAFGIEYSECGGDCARYYLLADGKVYPDDVKRINLKLKFSTKSLSDNKYKIAKVARDNYPDYLKENAGTTLGQPDSRDQGTIRLEVKTNGKLKVWKIDTDTSELPVEVKDYINEVNKILEALK